MALALLVIAIALPILPLAPWPNVSRWFETVDGRPAAARARRVGQDVPFKTDFDAETLKALFPQNFPKDA